MANSVDIGSAVDLFSGPGGWDVAARDLGIATVGIEFDKWACETRRAAGLETVEGDVRAYGRADFPEVAGLIASPPCQTFSSAGKGAGRKALDMVLACIEDMYWGNPLPEGAFEDERTALVLEPLRWAIEADQLGRPFEWLAFEQVPPVLPVWEATARVLRRLGYSVATGNVQAEQYGVPQTRKRAILVAHLDREVSLPIPTHSRYYPRNPEKLDPGVHKWVSMAEALGWGMTRRPSMTVTGGGAATGGAEPFGNAARQGMFKEQSEGRWAMRSDYGPRDERDRPDRTADQPAPTITSHADRCQWQYASSTMPNATLRDMEHPAPTVAFGNDYNSVRWVLRNNSSANAAERELDKPAPTLYFGQRANFCEWQSRPVEERPDADSWAYTRPSTTIVGSFRPDVIAAPGYQGPGDGPRQNTPGSIKVTAEEAACLQSFPNGYPWQGGKGKQFQQIGNAIPPGLAGAILKEVTT